MNWNTTWYSNAKYKVDNGKNFFRLEGYLDAMSQKDETSAGKNRIPALLAAVAQRKPNRQCQGNLFTK
jgi:hypothetical protein